MAAILKVLGFIALYFAIALGVLAAGVLALEASFGDPRDYPAAMLAIVLAALAVIGVTCIPYLNFAMRRSIVYAPDGTVAPVPEARLRAEIQAIGGTAPLAVTQKGAKLVVHWNYADGTVWGLLSKRRIKRVFEIEAKFDDAVKEAILTDVRRSVDWGVGPTGVRFGWGFSRGWLSGIEFGKAWGFKPGPTYGKAYDFKFSSAEIKRPVIDVILRCGWTARYGLW